MPDHNILNELEFEKHIAALSDRGLIEFVAREQYRMSRLCPIHDRDIKALQHRSRKELGATGGLGAILGVAIAGVIDYFLRR